MFPPGNDLRPEGGPRPDKAPRPGPAGRSGRNESAYLVHIAGFAARILGKDPETLGAETRANTLRFFALSEDEIPAPGAG
jgi:hypothetical protein